MSHSIRRSLAPWVAALGIAVASFGAAAEPGVAVSGQTLLENLRKGGYVVYFRHTKTLPEHEHEAKMRREGKWNLDDCATQRKALLTRDGKLDNSWETVKHDKVEQVEGKKGKEWKVTFKNPAVTDPGKSTLYVFLSPPGNYIAANFTGQ